MLVMLFTIGSGNVWGATSTITLTQSNLGLTGSYSSGATATVGGVTFTHTDLMKNSDNIQVKASTGVLYNSTAMPGKITNITITHTGTARSTKVYYGTTAQPTTNENSFSGSCNIDVSGNNTYFKITRGSNAAYWSSVEITYETAPASACTVTFTKTDGSTEAIKEASAGAGVTPPVMSTPCDGWAFQGWSTSQSTSTTSTTVLSTVTLTTGKYYPTSNVTLYPVYTKSGGSGFSKYELVALGGTITAGQYLISTGSYTMAGDGKSGASFTPGTTEATSKEYTIAINGSNLTIKGPDNKYIGGSSGSATLSFSASTPSDNNYKWKYTSTGIQFQGQTTRYIRANGTTDFRNYTTSNGTAAKLYKRIEADVTYYYSYPTCAAVCATPTALTKGSFNRGTQKMPINWTSAAGKVDVCYSTSSTKPAASPSGSYTVVSDQTSSPVNLDASGLSAGTNYYVWARSVCAADNKSDWVAVTGNYFTLPTHTLTVSKSGGDAGCSVTPTSQTVVEGRTVSISATAGSGYSFSSWSVTGANASLSSTSTNPTTFTMGTANATVTGTFVESCANSVTIQPANGTGTNCTFTVSPNGAQASCDGVTATVTITPTAGYGTPVVTQSGASAAPSISGGGSNSQTVTYAANTTGTSTISVVCSANNYTITLDKDLTPTTAGTASITATYNSNSNLTSAITKPTKTGWTFAGYFTAKNGGGTQIIDASGNVIASVSGYTDASRNWKHAGNITLYAKWTCTVTWSVNGLTNVYSTQTVTYNSSGSKVASVPTPDPASYCGDIFAGWSRKNAGAESKTTSYYDDLFKTVGDSPDIKSIGNITFYAVFANEE